MKIGDKVVSKSGNLGRIVANAVSVKGRKCVYVKWFKRSLGEGSAYVDMLRVLKEDKETPIKTKGTETFGDLFKQLEKADTKSLEIVATSAANLKRLLPDEGFTMRFESVINFVNSELECRKRDK